ncbi:hypothetical protein VTP01DRAFT_7760 [Rhizomucor pusillus]|uniref:uncharacterized protein n=1 Tax=Rhizomucor pusillus TaxID=4840 RepID=UPI003743C7A6
MIERGAFADHLRDKIRRLLLKVNEKMGWDLAVLTHSEDTHDYACTDPISTGGMKVEHPVRPFLCKMFLQHQWKVRDHCGNGTVRIIYYYYQIVYLFRACRKRDTDDDLQHRTKTTERKHDEISKTIRDTDIQLTGKQVRCFPWWKFRRVQVEGSICYPKMLKRQDIDLCGVDLENEIPLKPRNMSSKQFDKMYRALEEHKVYFEKFTFSGSIAEQRVALSVILRKFEWTLPEDSIRKDQLHFKNFQNAAPKDLTIVFKKQILINNDAVILQESAEPVFYAATVPHQRSA